MSLRTRLFKQLPWDGGLNTALDASLISPNQLTVCDNNIFDTRCSRKRRDGINFCYDNQAVATISRSSSGTARTVVCNGASFAIGDNLTISHTATVNGNDSSYNGTFTVSAVSTTTTKNDTITFTGSGSLTESSTADTKMTVQLNFGTQTVIGECDFWYGATSKQQTLVSVMSDGTIYSTAGGTRICVATTGSTWTAPLSTCSMAVYGNKVFFGVDGSGNLMKYWDGTNPVSDVPASYYNPTVSRSSSGTTRTIVLSYNFPGQVGSTLIITGMGNAAYNGTFTVASGTGTTTITYVASTTLTESSTSDAAGTVGQAAPQATCIREHLGRLVTNDKLNPDRVQFSQTDDWTLWYGYGDSGAVDVGVGDGDPVGVTGISPTFRGDLFVGKKTGIYRLVGQSPEEIRVIQVSSGVGVESHNSFAPVDDVDLMWVSDRGVHSLAATANYGDFDSSYVSLDIQKTFNEGFNRSRLKYVWGAYLGNINSVAFTFTETSGIGRVNTSTTVNNAVYLYNIPKKAWYRWPDISCQSLIAANDTDKKRFYIGSHQGRIAKTFNSQNYDISQSGVKAAIVNNNTSGLIALDGEGYTMKALKRFIIFYQALGTHTITASVKIDNIPLNPENSLNFSQTGSVALLGSTFILGGSVLGYQEVTSPYTLSIDGVGRTVQVSLTQDTLGNTVEIQGFGIEYEEAGVSAETFLF